MIKKILFIFLFVGFNISFAQRLYINPGIKLGYMFGEKGGFVFGYELSFLMENTKRDMLWGFVIDYDKINNMERLHLGIEAIRAVGLDIGPTFVWEDGKNYTGFSAIPFGGIILIPYYNFTYLYQKGTFHEIGSYVKISFGDYGFRLQ